MSSRKSFWIMTISLCLALMFLFSEITVAGPGPNPNIIEGLTYKLVGPNVNGLLVLGWRYNSQIPDQIPENRRGFVDAYLFVDGELYNIQLIDGAPEYNIYSNEDPSELSQAGFLDITPEWITQYSLPDEIPDRYNVPESAFALIYDPKDVLSLEIFSGIYPSDYPFPVAYEHLIKCEIKISFLSISKNQKEE